MIPARLVPIFGQHVRAAQVISGQASALSESAASVTERVNPDALIMDGVINLEEVDEITPAVDAFAATTERAAQRIGETQSPWLIGPVSNRIDRASEILIPASGVINASAEALHVGSDLLGRDAPSNILLMFTTPAEARGAGGFVGHWALVQADAGSFDIIEQYRTHQLNELLELNDAVLRADAEYTDRYGRFQIERHIQDVTLSPDFPSVAPVAADLFTQATGARIDAVLSIDPYVVQQLLQFTGPLDRSEGQPLSGANAAQELIVEQYSRFDGDDSAREAELSELTETLIERLFASPPDPITFATELAPLADQDRISLWLADDLDGSIAERLGLAGGFPQNDGDLLGVVHQNAGQNKIDSFLERTMNVTTTLDPRTNKVEHNVTVTLDNSAPRAGLPDAILASNDQGLDPGTNRMILSAYSALPVISARIDGQDAPIASHTEFGHGVYSFVIALGPGDFATLELRIAGSLDLSSGYNMTFVAQPLVESDDVSWHVLRVDDGEIEPPEGFTGHPDGARWASKLDRDKTISFDLGR
jgi:hypothetical protein